MVIGGTLLTGGRYSILGTLVGALVLQTLTTTVYTAGIAPEVTLVFKALVIIAVCLLQSPRTRALLHRTRRAAPPEVPTGAPPVAGTPTGATPPVTEMVRSRP